MLASWNFPWPQSCVFSPFRPFLGPCCVCCLSFYFGSLCISFYPFFLFWIPWFTCFCAWCLRNWLLLLLGFCTLSTAVHAQNMHHTLDGNTHAWQTRHKWHKHNANAVHAWVHMSTFCNSCMIIHRSFTPASVEEVPWYPDFRPSDRELPLAALFGNKSLRYYNSPGKQG